MGMVSNGKSLKIHENPIKKDDGGTPISLGNLHALFDAFLLYICMPKSEKLAGGDFGLEQTHHVHGALTMTTAHHS